MIPDVRSQDPEGWALTSTRPLASSVLRRSSAILLLASALAGGCTGSPRLVADDGPPVDVSTDPYAAFVRFDPPRAVRPASARITHRGVLPLDLAAFLDRLTSAVEAGNWSAVALFVDEDGLRAEMDSLTAAGLSPHHAAERTLISTLGLEADGVPLAGAGASAFAGLARVGTITVDDVVSDEAGMAQAEGYVRLDDRSTPRFAFTIRRTGRGPRLAVP